MKRQGTLRSSSDHQTSSTVHHVANSVGCMAGVFQLISSKYRTRRKFLTFGRRQPEKQSMSSSSSPRRSKPNSPARKCKGENRERFDDCNVKSAGLKEGSREIRRLSCEVPRSPTIPPEIRRSNSLSSPENFRSPTPSVVARLMGLEDTPPPPVAFMPSQPPESAVEKRRKLFGALEKCDEDLQALKRIIEAVRSTDRSKTPAAPPLVSVGKGGGMVAMRKCTDPTSGITEEQPSPVSVLEDFCESPPPSSTAGCYSPKRTQNDLFRLGRAPTLQLQRKKPGEDNVETTNFFFHNNNRLHVQHSMLHLKSDWTTTTLSPPRSSGESMEEAVNEVCRDMEMGHKREMERLGVLVEDFIYRDLIEEMTKDLMVRCQVENCLPFDKCKRKLCF